MQVLLEALPVVSAKIQDDAQDDNPHRQVPAAQGQDIQMAPEVRHQQHLAPFDIRGAQSMLKML